MIMATRIPLLRDQLQAAALRTAEQERAERRPAGETGQADPDIRPLVHQLEHLGYRVTLKRAAA